MKRLWCKCKCERCGCGLSSDLFLFFRCVHSMWQSTILSIGIRPNTRFFSTSIYPIRRFLRMEMTICRFPPRQSQISSILTLLPTDPKRLSTKPFLPNWFISKIVRRSMARQKRIFGVDFLHWIRFRLKKFQRIFFSKHAKNIFLFLVIFRQSWHCSFRLIDFLFLSPLGKFNGPIFVPLKADIDGNINVRLFANVDPLTNSCFVHSIRNWGSRSKRIQRSFKHRSSLSTMKSIIEPLGNATQQPMVCSGWNGSSVSAFTEHRHLPFF